MSKAKFILKLSQEGYDDLVNIQNYTYSEHGESQWKKYGQDLDSGLKHILKYPLSGRKRDDIPEGYLAWPVREHVMIYRVERKTIFLVRVLHSKMDFRFQFP